MVTQVSYDAIREAYLELEAARQNLAEARWAWQANDQKLQTAALVLEAAHGRLGRASTLLKSALASLDMLLDRDAVPTDDQVN